MNRNKKEEQKGKVFILDGSKGYQEGKNQNHLREEDITKMVDAYDKWNDQEKYCRVVDHDEIKENEYNLNIARYIDTMEEEEEIDVQFELSKLKVLEKERNRIESDMYSYLKEIGYDV